MIETAVHDSERFVFGIDTFEFPGQLRPTAQFAAHLYPIALGFRFKHTNGADRDALATGQASFRIDSRIVTLFG